MEITTQFGHGPHECGMTTELRMTHEHRTVEQDAEVDGEPVGIPGQSIEVLVVHLLYHVGNGRPLRRYVVCQTAILRIGDDVLDGDEVVEHLGELHELDGHTRGDSTSEQDCRLIGEFLALDQGIDELPSLLCSP